ncbi:unnamed protein product [Brachionus calyciflorus]|uniref:Cytochrome c oxidase assembly factor 5 n=1 Tax=Brachionus calyciflorus TaxID=104777 RepID=A0A814KPJ3_9BILA|nr:unnamed protein product [Brachionus calyciflorus]
MTDSDSSNPHSEIKRKCDGLRYDLKMCLLKSDCVQKYHTVPRKCLQDPEMLPHVPDKCWVLANTFFECKRSLIDMRRRFRGPKDRIQHLIKYQYGHSGIHSRAMDYMHYNFKCCGWNSPKDWYDSSYIDPKSKFKTDNNVITISPSYIYKIPHSCCVNNYDLTCVLMNKFHEVGCENIVKSYYLKIEIYIAWSIAFLNLFQLILLVLSLYLLCMIFFDRQESDRASSKDSDSHTYEAFDRMDEDNDQLFMTSYYL